MRSPAKASVTRINSPELADIKDKEKIKLQDFERRYEILEDEPDFLLQILPSRVSNAVKAIPADIKAMPQDQLEVKVKADFDARMLRQAFWMEFDRVVRTKSERFVLANVYNGLVELKSFYRDWIDNSFRLEYLLRPPTELQVMWEELLFTSTMKVKEMLELPMVDDKGRPNPKVMDIQLKTFMYLSDRRRGHVLGQARIEGIAAKSQMQVNVAIANQQAGQLQQGTDAFAGLTIEQIDEQIKSLESRKLDAPQTDIITEVRAHEPQKDHV